MSLNPPRLRRDDGLSGSTSTSFFNQASQVQNTGTMNIRVENNSNTHSGQASYKTRMELLLSHCALDALVDSNERFDPPKCAPHTRDAIQTDIVNWANALILSGLVMWITGSAGSGKSAIAQTIAERFILEGIPCAGFFFSRISGSSTRVDGDRLLPTIIYQLTLLIPEYKAAVLKKLNQDPAMFQRSRGAQISALFTKPLQQFSFRRMFRELRGGRTTPLVIVIDGLDECRDPQVQCDLLRIIADAAASIRRRPVRFLIASRPEAHITRTFEQHPNFRAVGLRRINLDDDQDATVAILTFLRQEILKIHEEHPLRNHLDPSWPHQDILDFIVSKSSPQFILASTAMSYVASPKHQPTERLSAIVDILNQPTTSIADKPLQRMDMLYTFIFDGIEEEHRDLVEAILGLLHLASLDEYRLPPITPDFLEKTLCLQPGDVYLRLEPLASVIQLAEHPATPIKSLHASLFDFLLSPARSKELALNLDHAHSALLGRNLLEDSEKALRDVVVIPPSPIVRMALEGLVIVLLFDGFPKFYFSARAREDIGVDAEKVFKLVKYFMRLLRDSYGQSRLVESVVIRQRFQPYLDKFYANCIREDKNCTKYDFRSTITEIEHCIYFQWDSQDWSVLLHVVLLAMNLIFLNEAEMKDINVVGSRLGKTNRTAETPEVQELVSLCRERILERARFKDSPSTFSSLEFAWRVLA